MSASAWDRAVEAAAKTIGWSPDSRRREHFEHCSLTQAAGIVRGFAAEVTQ